MWHSRPRLCILLFMLPGAADGGMNDYYENTWEVLVLVLVLVIVIVIEPTAPITKPPTTSIFILCEEAPLHDDS